MKTLLVLRHAKSSWNDASLTDHDRPLNERGWAAAFRMGRLIDDEGLHPDCILCSTAVRACQTVERLAEAVDLECRVDEVEEMYHAGPETLIDVLRSAPDHARFVMLVGHNPGLEDFVEGLTGESVTMPTAALVNISIAIDDWRDVSLDERGEVIATWLARELCD